MPQGWSVVSRRRAAEVREWWSGRGRLVYVTTNSKGQATYTYYPGKSRKYRAYAAATSTIWDDFSPVLTR